MIRAREALHRLREGNARFVAEVDREPDGVSRARRERLVAGQAPFAVVLGCSDSRVPAEMVFDQGLGDLFVIRLAGNSATPAAIGSVEYAVEHLGARLVVVLGHTGCGAVAACAQALVDGTADWSPGLRAVVEPIRPALESLCVDGAPPVLEELRTRGVPAHARRVRDDLLQGSPALCGLSEGSRDDSQGELMVVAAVYSMETGRVTFLDGDSDETTPAT